LSAEHLAQAGAVFAAAGLGAAILARPRLARLAGLGVWVAGLALFHPLLAPSGEAPRLVLAGVLGVAVAGGLAALCRRYPWALALLALAAAPVRIPVHVGDTSANLLVPLYVIVAGGVAGLAWSLVRDPPRARELGALAWPVALYVGWTSLSLAWTNDVREGAVTLFFFILPFGALALALARLPWRPRAVALLVGLLTAMALVFAAVGVWQWVNRDIFWNPKIIVANAYAPFYRVNSVFWDPSIYGRFLVLAILAVLGLILFRALRSWKAELALGAAIVALAVGLFFSFSQSSFVSLAVGVVLAASLAWRWRAAAVVAVVAAVMIPLGVAAPQLQQARDSLVGTSATGLNRATSSRFKLVNNGLRIAADHPLTGVGVGGFKRAYAERVHLKRKKSPPRAASHDTPVTVAAETGVVGLGLFFWLVAAGLLAAFRGNGDVSRLPQRSAVIAGLCFAAIFVHSLFYNAFFEDPLTWGLLALAVLAAGARSPRTEPTG
jgi:O-antigen ligase